jgi:hypothetical protein
MKPAAIFLLFLAVLAFGAMVDVAYGQQPGDFGYRHDLHHDWYQHLKQPATGVSCCNGTTPDAPGDCRPTKAYKVGDTWKALLDGEWVTVPPQTVIPSDQSHEPYQAHICASRYGQIWCFIEKQGGT